MPPVLTLQTPQTSAAASTSRPATFTQAVTFNAETGSVVLQVTNGATTDTYTNPTFASGVATFAAVDFDLGQNDVTATETDPAGNLTDAAAVPCSVTIGSAPVVTFTTPTSGQILCPNGSTTPGCLPDTDDTTPGWQGTLTVHVTRRPASRSRTAPSRSQSPRERARYVGAPVRRQRQCVAAQRDAARGTVTITATTDNIPNRGVGSGTVTVTVDMAPPAAPRPDGDRRRPSQDVHPADWPRPDNGARVAGYDVRYAKTQITNDTEFNAATPYPWGQPQLPRFARRHPRRHPLHRERLLLRREGTRRCRQLQPDGRDDHRSDGALQRDGIPVDLGYGRAPRILPERRR